MHASINHFQNDCITYNARHSVSVHTNDSNVTRNFGCVTFDYGSSSGCSASVRKRSYHLQINHTHKITTPRPLCVQSDTFCIVYDTRAYGICSRFSPQLVPYSSMCIIGLINRSSMWKVWHITETDIYTI